MAEKRKLIATQLVDQSIVQQKEEEEKEAKNLCDSDANLLSESDSESQDDTKGQLAYEAWKVREMKRILRDRQEREDYENELEETERRRQMTDLERENDRNKNEGQTNNE